MDSGEPQLLVVTDGGIGKRSYVENYRFTRRGAKGVKSINLVDGETVVAAIQIKLGDELLITTEKGQLVRIPIDEIRIVGRASKGVKIMDLDEGDKITGVARLIQVEGADKPETEAEIVDGAEAPAADAPQDPAEKSGGPQA